MTMYEGELYYCDNKTLCSNDNEEEGSNYYNLISTDKFRHNIKLVDPSRQETIIDFECVSCKRENSNIVGIDIGISHIAVAHKKDKMITIYNTHMIRCKHCGNHSKILLSGVSFSHEDCKELGTFFDKADKTLW